MASLIHAIVSNLLWSEGRTILIICTAIAASGLFIHRAFYLPAMLLFIFGFHFFRNPDRAPQVAITPYTFLSPADGTVVDICPIEHPNYTHKIAIFLSPLDVHVTRMPTAGTIEEIIYRPGSFTIASVPKSSSLNERNELTIRGPNNSFQYEIRQIAGTVARVIRTFTSKGANLTQGERCGMIKFGSRVELLLPSTVTVHVKIGDYLYGGETVIGQWN